MAKTIYTKDQLSAIEERNKNIIVSAQAGAGKTQVLVERILRLVCDEKESLLNMLIVTFTNKAAGEMRDRIKKGLFERLSEEKDSDRRKFIQGQYREIDQAQISTMHSFCINLLRKYFYKVGLDPQFKILKNASLESLKFESINELYRDFYDKGDDDLLSFIDQYSGDLDDSASKNMIFSIYEFLLSKQMPIEWLEENIYNYKNIDPAGLDKEIVEYIVSSFEMVKGDIFYYLDLFKKNYEDLSVFEYEKTYLEDLVIIKELEGAILSQKFSDIELKLQTSLSKLVSLTKISKENVSEEERKYLKDIRDKYKDIFNDFRASMKFDRDEIIEDRGNIACLLETVKKIIVDFDRRFKEKKNRLKGISFSDAEHYTITLLKDEKLLEEIKNTYKHIFFDEYQDANQIQNFIVERIKSENNLFFVGDIKQSIYSFRLADPSLFDKRYTQYKSSGSGLNVAIDLNQNFRSRKEILDFNNFIFNSLMTRKLGEVNYLDKSHQLICGNDNFPKLEKVVELSLIEDDKADLNDFTDNKKLLLDENPQTFLVAKKIKELVENGAAYRDNAILIRNTAIIPEVCKYLELFKIPYTTESISYNYESSDLNFFINILKAIDNDKDDLVLLGALKSSLGNFSDEELAKIRGDIRDKSFYYLFYNYSERQDKDEKIEEKIKKYIVRRESYNKREKISSLSDFIWFVFMDSGYRSYILSGVDAKKKLNNIMTFINQVEAYEEDTGSGLYNFLNYVENLKVNNLSEFGPSPDQSEENDLVRVMTIHKSKGLQFKNVFLIRLENKFNDRDLTSNLIFSNSQGISLKLYDAISNNYHENFDYMRIKRDKLIRARSEEVRILYVALTRAVDRLFLMGKYKANLNNLYVSNPLNAKNYLQWISSIIFEDQISHAFKEENGLNILSKNKFSFDSDFVTIKKYMTSQILDEKFKLLDMVDNQTAVKDHLNLDIAYKKILDYTYPYQEDIGLSYKKTVSELSEKNDNRSLDFKSYPKIFDDRGMGTSLKQAIFSGQGKDYNPMQKGTVFHYVLQNLDLKKYSEEELTEALNKMLENDFINREELNLIDVDKLLDFFNSPLCQRIAASESYHKEESFTMKIRENANDVYVDGQVDIFFIEDNKISIVDFKSNKVPNSNLYSKQLNYYAEGLSKALNLEIKDLMIYWIMTGEVTKIKREDL